MTKILVIFFIIVQSGCTTQKPYVGDVYIKNQCATPIIIVSNNDTGGYLDFIGGNKLIIGIGERKAWLTFNMSSIQVDKDISPLFIDKGNDNLRVTFLNSNMEKTFNAETIILLMKNITLPDDERLGRTIYEISDLSICPDLM
ncbi:TPA: hypothetical protein J1188_002587 [Escherichia coli]|nr:hypothetical protein [Escherichia coli]